MPAVLNKNVYPITRKDGYLMSKKENQHYSFAIDGFTHSTMARASFNPIRPSVHGSMYLHHTKNYVVLLNQFKQSCENDSNYNYLELEETFKEVALGLSELSLDELSFSLTYENSAFFVIRKENKEYHLNYFFDYNPGDHEDDQVVLVGYESGIKQPSRSGSFNSILKYLKLIFNNESSPIKFFIFENFRMAKTDIQPAFRKHQVSRSYFAIWRQKNYRL